MIADSPNNDVCLIRAADGDRNSARSRRRHFGREHRTKRIAVRPRQVEFHRENDHWVFSGPIPASMRGYQGDHADLLVRYMFTLTPEEQHLLLGRTPTTSAQAH